MCKNKVFKNEPIFDMSSQTFAHLHVLSYAHVLGINDGEECQPRTDVMDVTLRGPLTEKIATYNKYVSLYNPGSFINLIRSTYPVISTGVIREFRAVEGKFEGGKSLANTLDGDMNVAMLVYESFGGGHTTLYYKHS